MSILHASRFLSLIILAIPMTSCADNANKKTQPPVEVGTATWGRDLETALASSKESKKPVFAFFQEVPG